MVRRERDAYKETHGVFSSLSRPIDYEQLFQTPEMSAKDNQGILLDDETVIHAISAVSIGVLVNGFQLKEGQAYSNEWLYQAMQKPGWKTQFLLIK